MKHDQVPGVFAHIDVDGFRLEEFEEEQEDEQPDTLTTTRYVEAIAGANFTVRVSFSHDFPYLRDDILCRLWLDGKDVSGRIALKGRFDVPQFEGVTEHTKSGSYLRRFQFSDLVTSDEPVKGDMKKELKDLGTITLKLTRCVSSPSTRKEPTSDRSAFKPVGEDGVPEKSLKGRAISSRARYVSRERHQSLTENTLVLEPWKRLSRPTTTTPTFRMARNLSLSSRSNTVPTRISRLKASYLAPHRRSRLRTEIRRRSTLMNCVNCSHGATRRFRILPTLSGRSESGRPRSLMTTTTRATTSSPSPDVAPRGTAHRRILVSRSST